MKCKIRIYLLLFVITISIPACSFPNSVPATPTRHPLPPAPNFREIQIIPQPTVQSSLGPVSVTASAYLPDSPAGNTVDGNLETIWNSGAGAEQWIQLDLGAPITISAIRLIVSQFPAGETIHQIWGGADIGNMAFLHEFIGFTTDSDLLEFAPSTPLSNIRYIKIVTSQGPSWVAWREIRVIP